MLNLLYGKKSGFVKPPVAPPTAPSAAPSAPLTGKKYKVLVVGQTGAGKSTFLNMVCNYFRDGSLDNAPASLKVLIPTAHLPGTEAESNNHTECDVSDRSKSQTNGTSEYCFQDTTSGDIFIIVDTPGLSDTRGQKQDEINIQMIREHAETLESISAIFLLVNGRAARLTPSEQNTLVMLQGNIPDSASQNMIVIASNCATPSSGNFDFSTLPMKPKCIAFMENGVFSKHPRDWNRRDQVDNKINWLGSMDVIEQIMAEVRSFQTKGVEDWKVLNKERGIAKSKLHEAMLKMKNLQQLQESIEDFDYQQKEHQKNAQTFKNFTRSNTVTRKELVPASYHSTICSQCNYVCHDHCGLDEISSKGSNQFMGCAAFYGTNCGRCPERCSYTTHYHAKKTMKEVTETVEEVLQDIKSKYLSAVDGAQAAIGQIKTLEDAKRMMKDAIGNVAKEVERACEGITRVCKHFNLAEELNTTVKLLEIQKRQLNSIDAKRNAEEFINAIKEIIDGLEKKKEKSSSKLLDDDIVYIQDRETYLQDIIHGQADQDDDSDEEESQADEGDGLNDGKFLKLKECLEESDQYILQKIDFSSEQSLLNYVKKGLKKGDNADNRKQIVDELTHSCQEKQLTRSEAGILVLAIRQLLENEKQVLNKNALQVCKYFNAGGCRWGNNCKFLHQKQGGTSLKHERGKDSSNKTEESEREALPNKVIIDLLKDNSLEQLQKKSHCKIEVVKEKGKYFLAYTGRLDSIAQAKQLVSQQIGLKPQQGNLKQDSNSSKPSSTSKPAKFHSHTTEEKIIPSISTEAKLHLDASVVSFLLGKGGQNIKLLQHCCNVFIDQKESVMKLKGEGKGIKDALLKFHEQLSRGPTELQHHAHEVIVLHMSCPSERVGFLIGKGGQTIQKLQQFGNVSVTFEQHASATSAPLKGPPSTDYHKMEVKGVLLSVATAQEWLCMMIAGHTFDSATAACFEEPVALPHASVVPSSPARIGNALPQRPHESRGGRANASAIGRDGRVPGRGGRGGRGQYIQGLNEPAIATPVPLECGVLNSEEGTPLKGTSAKTQSTKSVRTDAPISPQPKLHPFEPLFASLGGEKQFADVFETKLTLAGFKDFPEFLEFLADEIDQGKEAVQNAVKTHLKFNLKESQQLAKAVLKAVDK